MTDDEWLLISAAEIVDVPADEWATVNVLGRFVPLFGRLIIKCKKGNTFSRYVFNLSKYLDQASVKEMLPCLYSGENFDGYDRVICLIIVCLIFSTEEYCLHIMRH